MSEYAKDGFENTTSELYETFDDVSSIEYALTHITQLTLDTFLNVNYGVLCEAICIFGIFFNIINIIVFVKQGFEESVNISLLGLAVADTAALTSQVWMNMMFSPVVPYVPYAWYTTLYLTGSWPHVTSTRAVSLLTVFITLERYLCVALPLKIKRIITHKTTAIIVTFIFLFTISTAIPVYAACYVGDYFDPATNSNTITLFYIPNGLEIESIGVSFGAGVHIVSFTLVVAFTAALIKQLHSKSKWRKSSSSASKNKNISNRDKVVVKMIIFISGTFIACYSPSFFGTIAIMCVPEFGVAGKYQNIFNIYYSFVFTIDSFNSAINIFVYLKMSSKYRQVFLRMFSGVLCFDYKKV
ncbi:uncharacterized protein LOC131951958 [Physella acuta]|uniref:uncharacterized protein LOC131951958 n=1 Tax=Physella acuta TaxID=109671 RepID=UPI0027DAFBF9|nr:uncharacterized protein LOC131951958 [Physella acuta]